MITKFTKKDIKNGKFDINDLYDQTSLMSNNLRSIYNLFGWVHMIQEFSTTPNLLDELLEDSVNSLKKDGKEARYSSGGMTVFVYFNEDDMLEIDVYFNIT